MKKTYKAVIESQLSGDRMTIELKMRNKQAFREEMAAAKQTIVGDTVEEKELFDFIQRQNDFFIFEDKKGWNAARKGAKAEMEIAKRRGF